MKVIYSTDNEVILEIDLDIDWADYQKNIDFFVLFIACKIKIKPFIIPVPFCLLSGHRYPICDLASSGNQMVSSDEQGNIIIWSLSGSSFKQTHSINGSG